MAEKKVAKLDAGTIVFRKENGEKIIARGSCFEGDQAVAVAGQVFEVRREDGSLVVVVRDRLKVPSKAEIMDVLYDLTLKEDTEASDREEAVVAISALFGITL